MQLFLAMPQILINSLINQLIVYYHIDDGELQFTILGCFDNSIDSTLLLAIDNGELQVAIL